MTEFLSYSSNHVTARTRKLLEVIESKSGFHILYVVERRSTLIQDKIVKYRAKHILKRVDDEWNEKIALSH